MWRAASWEVKVVAADTPVFRSPVYWPAGAQDWQTLEVQEELLGRDTVRIFEHVKQHIQVSYACPSARRAPPQDVPMLLVVTMHRRHAIASHVLATQQCSAVSRRQLPLRPVFVFVLGGGVPLLPPS